MAKSYSHFSYDSNKSFRTKHPFYVRQSGGNESEGIRIAVFGLTFYREIDGRRVEDIYKTDKERREKARKSGWEYVRHKDGSTTLKKKAR